MKRKRRIIVFVSPSFDPFESFLGPGPVFTPKGEDARDVFLHPSTLDSPRHIFTSADLHIFPPSLVCELHSFFNCVVHFFLADSERTSQELEFVFKGKSVTSRLLCQSMDRTSLQARRCSSTMDSQAWEPSPTFLLLQSGLVASIPRHPSENGTQSRSSHPTPILCLVQFSFTFAKSCVAIFCHNLGASTASFAETSTE